MPRTCCGFTRICLWIALPAAVLTLALTGPFATGPFGTSTGDAVVDTAHKPVGPVEEVLEAVMYNVGDSFDALETAIEKKRFKTVGRNGLFLAEIMNLAPAYKTAADGATAEEKADAKAWKGFADGAKDALLEMTKIAKTKDQAAATAQFEKIDAACEKCHDKFQ